MMTVAWSMLMTAGTEKSGQFGNILNVEAIGLAAGLHVECNKRK